MRADFWYNKNMIDNELQKIVEKFAASGWEMIDVPSKAWLADMNSATKKQKLIEAVKKADKDCGTCGCELDALYKKALTLLMA